MIGFRFMVRVRVTVRIADKLISVFSRDHIETLYKKRQPMMMMMMLMACNHTEWPQRWVCYVVICNTETASRMTLAAMPNVIDEQFSYRIMSWIM